MTARTAHPAASVLAEPKAYSDEKRLYEALAYARAHEPVSWVDVPPYAPFWAITKHADVMDIERQNDLFTNDPRPFLEVAEFEECRHFAPAAASAASITDRSHVPAMSARVARKRRKIA